MLKTKKEVVVDSRTGQKAIIGISAPGFQWDSDVVNKDKTTGKVSFLILIEKKIESKIELVTRVPAIYRREKFLEIVGDLKFNEFETMKDELMKMAIEENSSDYYGLKAVDFVSVKREDF